MKISINVTQYINMLAVLMFTAGLILMTAGCDEIDTGEVQNSVPLPVDSVLNFNCENEGIFPEDCVLDNPENPYARVSITEDNKFRLNEEAPSAKSRYYLWATALVRGAGIPGENQFYTALSLHEVYTESGSPTTRNQAIKAYRSVLDNFFLAPTFFVVPVDGEDASIAVSLKDIVGANLFNPTSPNLVSLYTDPALALSDISEWGYVYNPATGIMSVFE
ncbi:MAG: hypothetical protein PVG12_04215 [Gammaproteobacteria bacterium]|jgi:hypothetical protein